MAKNIRVTGADGSQRLVRVPDNIANEEIAAGRATLTSKGRYKRAVKAKQRDKILFPKTGYNRSMRRKYGDYGVGVDPNRIREAIANAEAQSEEKEK